MQEIVNEVLKAESDAEKILSDARQKANTIRAKADTEVTSQVSAARDDAQKIVQDKLTEARTRAESDRNEKLDAARREVETTYSIDSEQFNRAVQRIIERLITPEIGE